MAFALPSGWDADFSVEEEDGALGALPVQVSERVQRTSHQRRVAASKATELLRRATEASRLGALRDDGPPPTELLSESHEPEAMAIEIPGSVLENGEPRTLDSSMGDVPNAFNDSSIKTGTGMFGEVSPPRSSDPEVRAWTRRAPETLLRERSFRACVRKGFVAVPVSNSGPTYRVRLLRITPELCRRAGVTRRNGKKDTGERVDSSSGGLELLEHQMQAGFATPLPHCGLPPVEMSVPKALVPCVSVAMEVLKQYCEVASASLGPCAQQVFDLLDAFFDGDVATERSWPPTCPLERRRAAQRLSTWLARVNKSTVGRHLQNLSNAGSRPALLDLRSTPSSDEKSPSRLMAVYHHLSANSIRNALRELNGASQGLERGARMRFDRLAAIVASCGGASTPCVERRQCLRQQLREWRKQGQHELMGPSLWRLYSLLAGDLEWIVSDSLDWHTAFGLFFWYRTPAEDEKPSEGEDLLSAIRSFEAVVKKHGSACRFRPAPEHVRRVSRSTSSTAAYKVPQTEPYDIEFNLMRAAVQLVSWSELQYFDYLTYTNRPLDVALSWHLCVLLVVLSGGDTTKLARFQHLTQQYCFMLELLGHWQWAIHVALFLSEPRARALAVQGLLTRNAEGSPACGVRSLSDDAGQKRMPMASHSLSRWSKAWPGVPQNWICKADALRCEIKQRWPAAVECWLGLVACHGNEPRSEMGDGTNGALASPQTSVVAAGATRALVLVVSYLLPRALLWHASADFHSAPTEAITLMPMTAPARWLQTWLQEIERDVAKDSAAWALSGHVVLQLMKTWSEDGRYQCTPSELIDICRKGDVVRRCEFGIPW